MATHLENLEKILEFILKETPAEKMIKILYERVKFVVETYIIQRDIENFIAYFKFILSTSRMPKRLKFEPKLIQVFIDQTYAGYSGSIQEFRANRLYEYLKNKIKKGVEITNENLELLEETLRQLRKPTLEKIMEQVRIAIILKWLQGPLKEQLSKELQDYIIFLATIYGQYQKNRVLNVEWQPYEISQKDMTTLIREYRIFEIAIIEALQTIRNALSRSPDPNKYQEEFRTVIISLDSLIKMSKEGKLNSADAFKDKIVVATALIYIQDDFVEKDPELKKLIQLFISLYYQFSDKRYTAVVER